MTLGWPPTEKRGPIAADYSSPGPIYMLPTTVGHRSHDPRSSLGRAPSFAFGYKHATDPDSSPGPVYKPHPHLTHQGKKSMTSYSLYSRHSPPPAYNTPGVGSYQPESARVHVKRKAPEYTFAKRLDSSHNDMPAPNRYHLDQMIGRTIQGSKPSLPSYSMASRYKRGAFYEDLAKTPGPARNDAPHTNVYKPKPPTFSMIGRHWMPGDVHPMPGPNRFLREKVKVDQRFAPAYSFGTRHSQHVLSPRIPIPKGSESLNMLAHLEWSPTA